MSRPGIPKTLHNVKYIIYRYAAFLGEYILQREYKIILIAYLVMQLTSGIGTFVTLIVLNIARVQADDPFLLASVIWLTLSFSVTVLIVFMQLRKSRSRHHPDASALIPSVFWIVFGVVLAILVQGIMIYIETLFGIDPGSENTEELLAIIQQIPQFVIVIIVLGPILEEIVFRKIIFGYLNQRINTGVAALSSACLFSLAHLELEHFLLYTGIGLVFTFLYERTKRISVPILAHILMNAFVVLDAFLF